MITIKNNKLIIVAVFWILNIISNRNIVVTAARSRNNNNNNNPSRTNPIAHLEQQCLEEICTGNFDIYEKQNCIMKCISPTCWERFYGNNPLEDGEVDEVRKGRFNTCAATVSLSQPYFMGKENVTPKEREIRDSEWENR
jgi:hypothetical protein